MYFYFLNLDTASFQSSGLNRLTESATTTAKIAKGINTSIIQIPLVFLEVRQFARQYFQQLFQLRLRKFQLLY